MLYALRAGDDAAARTSVAELARRFRLDPLLVRRLAEAEGISLPGDDSPSDPADPNGATRSMSRQELERER